jgi:cobalt-zinc-cadmium efflux system outer membrane protein
MARLLLLCASAATLAARAQPVAPPPEVDLAQVLQLAREASPRLAAERTAVAIAEAERVTAGTHPNPVVGYGYTRPAGGAATLFEGSRQQDVAISQPLLIAGQRGARIEAAERAIEAARARVAANAASLGVEAAVAFVGLASAQERAALLASGRMELERLRGIVAGRQQAGAASQYDLARVEVEVAGWSTRLEEARAEIDDRSGGLAALLGLSGWRPRAKAGLAPLGLQVAPGAVAPERAAGTPAAVAAQREEAAARAGIEVARRERFPVPSIGVGRTWTSEPFGAANLIGLSVEVPIFDTRRGPLDRARAEALAATLRRELAYAEAAANLERYAAVVGRRQAALGGYDRDTAARLPGLGRMAEDAYRLGRGTILELLDATRSRYELQLARIDLVAGLVEAELRYLGASGEVDRAAGR